MLDPPHGLDHVLAVPVCRVDHQHVDAGLQQRADPLVIVDPDRRPDAQPPPRVLAGMGIAVQLVDVLDRDQPFQSIFIVNQQKFLDLIFRQNPISFLEAGVGRGGDQVVLGHDLLDPEVVGLEEAEVAAGEDAAEVAVDGDRHARDVVPAHDLAGLADGGVGRQGDRVDDDPVLGPLDLVDLAGLLLDRHVLVDDAEAALLGQRDGQLGLGDRVHRRGEDRDVQADPRGELRPGVDLVREQVGVARLEQDVVEGDALVGDAVVHREKLRSGPGSGRHHDVTLDLTDKLTDRIERSAGPDHGLGRFRGLSLSIKPARPALARATDPADSRTIVSLIRRSAEVGNCVRARKGMACVIVLILLCAGCFSVLGHELRAFVVLRVVVPLVELDGEAAVEGILRQVGPGGLGMRAMTCLSSRSASAYFLAVSFRGGQRLLGMIDDPGDHRSGAGWRLGRGGP